jgi:hypothetical protein
MSMLVIVSAILGCMHLRNASEARFQLVKNLGGNFLANTYSIPKQALP